MLHQKGDATDKAVNFRAKILRHPPPGFDEANFSVFIWYVKILDGSLSAAGLATQCDMASATLY